MKMLALLALAPFAATTPAAAKVVTATDAGFVVEHEFSAPVRSKYMWQTLLKPSVWWTKAHTYSGDSANISLDPKPGGCWCETLKRGQIEHMRVLYLDLENTARFSGALGPLQAGAVTGTLTFKLKPEGEVTRVTMTYVVSGYHPQGLKSFAAAVDGVLGEQVSPLRKAAVSAAANAPK